MYTFQQIFLIEYLCVNSVACFEPLTFYKICLCFSIYTILNATLLLPPSF